MPTNDIGEVIEVLRHDDSVDHVTVNSTLGKHYVAESVRLCEKTQTFGASTHHVIDGENRGRALILCNKKDRDGWEFQYNDAVFILKKQFGLKVTESNFVFANTDINWINQTLFNGHNLLRPIAMTINW